MNGSVLMVHNGRTYRPVEIKPSMFGTKLGEYVRTKEICVYRRRKNKKKSRNHKKSRPRPRLKVKVKRNNKCHVALI